MFYYAEGAGHVVQHVKRCGHCKDHVLLGENTDHYPSEIFHRPVSIKTTTQFDTELVSYHNLLSSVIRIKLAKFKINRYVVSLFPMIVAANVNHVSRFCTLLKGNKAGSINSEAIKCSEMTTGFYYSCCSVFSNKLRQTLSSYFGNVALKK
jgi:hypothetical protein